MGKAKTLKKQPDTFEPMIVKLKPGLKTKRLSPQDKLADKDFIYRALMDALKDDDVPAFKEILKAHFEAINTDQALKKAKISKTTFYSALSAAGNPSLKTIAKILRAVQAA